MIPTINQVLSDTRVLLTDPNGQRFDNNVLNPYLQTAWANIHSQALHHNLPLIHRSVFPILQPFTSILYPSIAGIANMGEPVDLYERSFDSANSIAIDTITYDAATGIATVTTLTPHPFLSGQNVTHHGIQGLSDDINDIWMIEKINSTSYRIRGIFLSGTHTASTGTATYSTESFVKIDGPVPEDWFTETYTPATFLSFWRWERDRFRFPGSTAARQLKVTFQISDALPVSVAVPLGIDGCLPFLKFRTAGLALTEIAPQSALNFNAVALGPTMDPVDLGGLLGELLRPQVRTSQEVNAVRRPPYRRKRSVGPHTLLQY